MLKALLLGLVAVIGMLQYPFGSNMIDRPIIIGPLVGLVLGDVVQGIMIGGMLELAMMGVMYIGGATSLNVLVGGLIGTAIAIETNTGIEVAATIAIPVGIIYNLILQGYAIVVQYFLYIVDDAGAEGNHKKVSRIHFGMFGIWITFTFLVVFVSSLVGPTAVQKIVDVIPDVIYQGIGAGTLLLPALGFGILLNLIWDKKIAPFFFIGFALAAFLQLNNLAIALIAISIGFIVFYFSAGDDLNFNSFEVSDGVVLNNSAIDKKTLNRVLLRSFTLESSFNYVKFQGLGYCISMIPVLEKLYDNKEDMAKALERHLVFFNTSPQFVSFILGISIAMEEENATNEDFDPNSINAVKAALMGPIAGIGDAFWWGIVRVVAASIAIDLALKGSLLAPFAFIIVFNVPQILFRYYGLKTSYRLGKSFITKISESNFLQHLSLAAGIAGLMVIGGMTVSMIGIRTPLEISFANMDPISIQEMLDSIMPGILPLTALFSVKKLVNKNVKVTTLMILLLVVGILGSLIGVF